jgi:hypothetical protein
MADSRQTLAGSTGLDRTRRRIARWREIRRHPHAPMPAPLWDAAVAAARRHGLYRTARTLRVDYGALKNHLEAATAVSVPTLPAPTFVALTPSGVPGAPACVIEIDGPRGTLRIRLSDLALRDIVTVAQMVWSDAR